MRIRAVIFVVVMLAAVAPLTYVAASTIPATVMTARSTMLNVDPNNSNSPALNVTGNSCSTLTAFNLYDSFKSVVTASAATFGFSGSAATESHVTGNFDHTSLGQRIFSVYAEVYSDPDIEGMHAKSEFEWWGFTALTCLPDGRMQFSYKPAGDHYFDQYNRTMLRYVEGNLGGMARIQITLDLPHAGFTVNVTGPVVLHQTAVKIDS